MSGRKCRPPTARAGSIIILAHICSGLDLLEKAPAATRASPQHKQYKSFSDPAAADTRPAAPLRCPAPQPQQTDSCYSGFITRYRLSQEQVISGVACNMFQYKHNTFAVYEHLKLIIIISEIPIPILRKFL